MFYVDIEKSRKNLIKNDSAWIGLIPFAIWLINSIKPKMYVELGTHYGHSYFSICETLKDNNIDCECYAIDTWQGDEFTKSYNDSVYNQVAETNKKYSTFSHLLKLKFQDGLHQFCDQSIDVLHIDGSHTYDDAKNDFDNWLPKLKKCSIVLFHDICVTENNFGVFKLWNEIKESNKHTFELHNSSGLGVLFLGDLNGTHLRTYNILNENQDFAREYFAKLGDLLKSDYVIRDLAAEYIKEKDNRENLNANINKLKNDYRANISALSKELNDTVDKLNANVSILNEIQNTKSWRITLPLRKMNGHLIRFRLRINKLSKIINTYGLRQIIKKCQSVISNEGMTGFAQRIRDVTFNNSLVLHGKNQRINSTLTDFIERCNLNNTPTSDSTGDLLFSIILPVYNPPLKFLKIVIDSVIRQNYTRWELLIVDDASPNPDVRQFLKNYINYPNIKIKFSDLNHGISKTSNIALEMANGDFVVLLDNDDILTYDALSAIYNEIKIENPDILYSDEALIDEDGNPESLYLKPDWSPVLMHNCMYTGHLGVYRTSLIRKIGGFRSEYDFSQDYDLMLRASEFTQKIKHVEKVLYGWRMIKSSASAGGKPFARISNVNALNDYIKKKFKTAAVSALPTANRIDLNISERSVAIVVPSDNESNIKKTIESIFKCTDYASYKIYIVTNSKIISQIQNKFTNIPVQFVAYDKPYNFSDKCNEGAFATSEELLLFFNDDVRVLESDWLRPIVDYLSYPGVGIVGPKLVYEDGKIQHAGMVTAVRRLVGTAFHCLDKNTNKHFNYAQSVREVSLICGACLGIEKSLFEKIGGFDPINFPINHSDVDLCFKVRRIGYSCVYTPHSELMHIGHMSIGSYENSRRFKVDKADISLLKKWPEYISYDPYFTDSMRALIYHDSPEEYKIYPSKSNLGDKNDYLLISHDLSLSGAPRVLCDIAKELVDEGNFVVLMSPKDGPMRDEFNKVGCTVIVDELCMTTHKNVIDFGKNFDAVIGNTVLTAFVLEALSQYTKTIIYIHETDLLEHLFENDKFVFSLKSIKKILCGSKLPAKILKKFGFLSTVIPYTSSVIANFERIDSVSENINIGVFASYEARKGQDLLIHAYNELENDIQNNIRIDMFGRILDAVYFEEISRLTRKGNIYLGGELEPSNYIKKLAEYDIIFIPSRTDTLPIVSIDALSLGIPVACSSYTGTADYIYADFPSYVSAESTPRAFSYILKNLNKDHIKGQSEKCIRIYNNNFSNNCFKENLLNVLKF